MKKALFIFLCGLFTANMNAQSLDDFYENRFEIYSPFSGISSNLDAGDSLGMNSSIKFWGILNLGGTFSNTKKWGSTFYVGERQIGDLFFILKGLFSKNDKPKDFENVYYLSDFGFLPNLRWGLNVFATENTTVNIGLYHSYYLTNGDASLKNDWLAVGPNINFDRTLNNWLALRLATGPMFSYANGAHSNIKPGIWESKVELFTKAGFFVCFDYLIFSKLVNDQNDDIKIKRYDTKIGLRF